MDQLHISWTNRNRPYLVNFDNQKRNHVCRGDPLRSPLDRSCRVVSIDTGVLLPQPVLSDKISRDVSLKGCMNEQSAAQAIAYHMATIQSIKQGTYWKPSNYPVRAYLLGTAGGTSFSRSGASAIQSHQAHSDHGEREPHL